MNITLKTLKKGKIKDILIIIVLSFDYSAAYIICTVWKIELGYFIASTAIVSAIAGTLIGNVSKTILFTCVSLVIGMILSVLLLILPPLTYGHYVTAQLTIDLMLPLFVRLFFFGGLPTAFVCGLLGSTLKEILS